MKVIWNVRSPTVFAQSQTQILVISAWGGGLSWSTLVQSLTKGDLVRDYLINERESFGVQQLPLFNLLKFEELDWRIRHSWLEGGRWLNTRVPRNFHSMIWRFIAQGMGLKMLLYPKTFPLISLVISYKISFDSRLYKVWSAQDTSSNTDD